MYQRPSYRWFELWMLLGNSNERKWAVSMVRCNPLKSIPINRIFVIDVIIHVADGDIEQRLASSSLVVRREIDCFPLSYRANIYHRSSELCLPNGIEHETRATQRCRRVQIHCIVYDVWAVFDINGSLVDTCPMKHRVIHVDRKIDRIR